VVKLSKKGTAATSGSSSQAGNSGPGNEAELRESVPDRWEVKNRSR
jgi:hypothetical protein